MVTSASSLTPQRQIARAGGKPKKNAVWIKAKVSEPETVTGEPHLVFVVTHSTGGPRGCPLGENHESWV